MPIRDLVQAKVSGQHVTPGALGLSGTEASALSDEQLAQIIADLTDTFWAYDICVGLAAPQIGYEHRVAVVNATRDLSMPILVLVDPVVLREFGKKDVKRESCMSMWGMQGDVERRRSIELEYSDDSGQRQQRVFEGFEARVIQHEVDHLNGVLYNKRLRAGARLVDSAVFDNSERLNTESAEDGGPRVGN